MGLQDVYSRYANSNTAVRNAGRGIVCQEAKRDLM